MKNKMNLETFSFSEELQFLCNKADPNQRVSEVEFKDTKTIIKIYVLEEVYYIRLQDLYYLLSYYMKIPYKKNMFYFIKEIVNVYKLDELNINLETSTLELCRIDHLTDHIFSIIEKKFFEIKQSEDEQMFNKINICSPKNDESSIDEKCPFDDSQHSIKDVFSNIYKSNDFIEEPLTNKTENPPKKYMGRGRCRVKQENLKDRPFVCAYVDCKRAFKRFEHLKRHNKMHTGERPYKCKYPGCLKSFSRSDNLSQHLKIHNVPLICQKLNFRDYYHPNKNLE